MAEQMEDPAEAKGLVHREIVKIITPGLNIDQDEKQVNQIVSIESDLTDYHLVFFNLSLNHSSTLSIEKDFSLLTLTLLQNHVVEVILDDQELMSELSKSSYFLLSTHRVKSKGSPQSIAEERLLSYLEFTQKQRVEPKPQNNQQAIMAVDYSSALNLELTESIRHSSKKNTLWGFLDKTCTTMGSRRLREWILKPLYSREKITLRQDKIAYLIDHFLIAHQMSEQLTKIADIYKINTKISYQSASAQELVRLKQSLLAIQDLKELLKESPLDEMSELPDMADIIDLLSKTLQDEVPVYLKDGQTIREGVNQELDELRALLADSNSWLLEYENQQKQLTGIKNLKVGYSRTFGYYIEVSKSQVHLVDESLGYKA